MVQPSKIAVVTLTFKHNQVKRCMSEKGSSVTWHHMALSWKKADTKTI